MNLKTNQIQSAFQDLFNTSSKEEELAFKEQVLVMKFLGEIDEVMAERDLKKKDLAAKVGTSASYITQIFRGNRIPNHQIIIKMADALEIDFVITTKKKHDQLLHIPKADKSGMYYYKPFDFDLKSDENYSKSLDADTYSEILVA
ncbi:helix-turn-helix domain-containing protein [Belliella pelovolcani]|uniref:Helix-turn-helix n=1 Tax=Belliella pelovolcani TaxID=529505 RepID=A0A1N7PM76_9BACT|nr:helix-turn-helix transcriptional regulator [Belliella pelovolcani]SIT11698.1 Helix-turn-helix [Belliella pelovolcani]